MIQVGRPVKGMDFIGREDEINLIIEYIKMGQSVVVIAPRRFGKSSLVIEVLNRLKKQKWYTGWVDIFEYANPEELSQSIVEEVLDNKGLKTAYQKAKGSVMALIKSIQLKSVVEDFEFIIGIEDPDMDGATQFGYALDFVNSLPEKSGKKMAFAFDEYGDMLKFNAAEELVKMTRAKVQKHDNATYIFSGSYESVMETLFMEQKSPFYRLARTIKLGYLKFDDLKKYMVKKLKSYDVKPDIQLIEDSIDFLKGHPYYCQLALQQMYLFEMTQRKAPSFDELLELIINVDRGYIEKSWESLSGSRENVLILKHLSKQEEGVYSINSIKKVNPSRAIKKLEGQGILYRTEKGYTFYDPVFQYWIATTIK